MRNNWYKISDVDLLNMELKKKTGDINELASGVLRLIVEQRYLNGMVARGRGSDIDADCPTNNIFQYVLELEAENAKLQKRVALVDSKFVSSNTVEVDLVVIRRAEWMQEQV